MYCLSIYSSLFTIYGLWMDSWTSNDGQWRQPWLSCNLTFRSHTFCSKFSPFSRASLSTFNLYIQDLIVSNKHRAIDHFNSNYINLHFCHDFGSRAWWIYLTRLNSLASCSELGALENEEQPNTLPKITNLTNKMLRP